MPKDAVTVAIEQHTESLTIANTGGVPGRSLGVAFSHDT